MRKLALLALLAFAQPAGASNIPSVLPSVAGGKAQIKRPVAQQPVVNPLGSTIVHDLFTTANAAPAGTLTAVPGPGTWNVRDPTAVLSISNGAFHIVSGTSLGSAALETAAQTNTTGLALFARVKLNTSFSANVRLVHSSAVGAGATSPKGGFNLAFDEVAPMDAFTQMGGLFWWTAVNIAVSDPRVVDLLVVSLHPGTAAFARYGSDTKWTLLWVNHVDTNATLFGVATTLGKSFDIDQMDEVQLAGPWSTLTGAAVSWDSATADNQEGSGVSEGITEHTITAATGVTQELSFRRTNDSNRMVVRMDQAGSTVKLIEVNAGVETQRATAAQTWTNGTQYRIVVAARGHAIRVWVGTTLALSYDAGSFNFGATGWKVSKAGTSFGAWANKYDIPLFAPYYTKTFLAYGDSKTNGQGDDTSPYPLGQNGWAKKLWTDLTTADPVDTWGEVNRIGISSQTVANMKARIDSDLARILTVPDLILCSLGANDAAAGDLALANETTWKTNYLYILDAMHDRWPNATIYLARFWRQGFDTEADRAAGWEDYLLTQRSFLRLGPDERVVLKGSDNGVSETVDGVHPNPAGHTAMAAAWKTALGY